MNAEANAAAETFLVVVDDTPECAKAMRFAALRARHTGARVLALHVLKPTQFLQWGSAQQDIEEEAEQLGQALLAATATEAEALTGQRPETRLLRGRASEAVLEVVTSDRSIRALVLGAAAKGKPGPLVDFFAGERAGSLPCMVMIIPGGISDSDLDRLT
ncbi:universal stress protein [Sandaracinobacter sp. RS1-74]|uniref:universal stress protein n=1 Tax=Sandaracinobacteroides sayramensis TaxID=2913411 RepID=UPI001EDA77E1|nr:universal stress protein [Sandaracinobacteroides sayramensis]MCG2840114.1 universal stress protein [Sandaracinobacteroides sayramensis]